MLLQKYDYGNNSYSQFLLYDYILWKYGIW